MNVRRRCSDRFTLRRIRSSEDSNSRPRRSEGLPLPGSHRSAGESSGRQRPAYVGGPNEIATPLDLYASTGLALNDNITDVGGSQDLIGDGNAVEFASGEQAVIAQGVVTVPSADGTYHVWATPQEVSVLGPNLAQSPTGQPPDELRVGAVFSRGLGAGGRA